GMPPAGLIRLAGGGEQRLVLLAVHSIQLEQVRDVAFLEADPPQLHPADLRLGGPDRPARRLAGDSAGFSKLTQPGTQLHTADSRPTCGFAVGTRHAHTEIPDPQPARLNRSRRPVGSRLAADGA